MIEKFNSKHKDFFVTFTIASERWKQLAAMFTEDYPRARVLFMTEVLALIDKWREPTTAEFNRILGHMLDGGQVAFPPRSIWDILLSVWPLEVAKYNTSMLRTFVANPKHKLFPMTLVTLSSTAIVQSWWAFETLMNDVGSIIGEERKATLDQTDRILLEERTIGLDSKGNPMDKQNYQPIDARIQFIYHMLTGANIDRGGKVWMNLMDLKNARDGFVHRLGKPKADTFKSFLDSLVPFNGLKAVQTVVGDVFMKTPEFLKRFIYKFLHFWSCSTDSPWIWDGSQGGVFHMGLGKIEFKDIITLHAPLPAAFGEPDPEIEKHIAEMEKKDAGGK